MSSTERRSRHTRKLQRRGSPGSAPGTLVIDPHAHPSQIQVLCYDSEHVHEQEIRDVGELRPLLDRYRITWINVNGLGTETTLLALAKLFDIHRLALEDTVNVHQRPKAEDYAEHPFFIVARMPAPGISPHTEQLSMFLGRNFVLTFQERPGDCLDPVRNRVRKGGPLIRGSGPDYLAYAILDAVLDSYFPLLERYSDILDRIETRILRHADNAVLGEIHDLKAHLGYLRRLMASYRTVFAAMEREEHELIGETVRLYLRDCHDHSLQLADLVAAYRETCSSLMDLHLTNVSNRMNEVMKVLTITATIFIPLTFIAGVYGMNFDTEASPFNMPELEWYFGYPLALALMALLAVAMLIYFRRRGWLRDLMDPGQNQPPDASPSRAGSEPGGATPTSAESPQEREY